MAKKNKNIEYNIVVNEKYTLSGKPEEKNFVSKEDLTAYLDSLGYDTEDEEMISLIENGGENKGLNDIEFTIEIKGNKKKKDLKDSFQNAEDFLEEYKSYLIGKKLLFESGEKAIITDIKIVGEDENGIAIETDTFEDILLDSEENEFKMFIEGEKIAEFNLILQDEVEKTEEEKILEEKEKNKINKSENKYFIINDNLKLIKGFEFKEDAESEISNIKNFGKDDYTIVSIKKLIEQNIDPNDNENWKTDLNDFSIIKESLDIYIKDGHYTKEKAEGVLEFYKQGKLSSSIKGSLVINLERKQKQLRTAFVTSNIKKVTEINSYIKRLNDELINILILEEK